MAKQPLSRVPTLLARKEAYHMAETAGIALENFRVLVERAGLSLSSEELTVLKPMFDFYAEQIRRLHEVELGAEDLAVTFDPGWDPQR
jgi:hypothetical protein